MQQSQRTGIDPRVIIAQTALETGFGQNMVGNNYFGIKGVGNQPTINANTIEFQDGQSYTTDADFRKFNKWGSFDAYGDLMLRDMYEGVRNAPTALKQAQFLQDAGYATDPRYAEKLTNLINMMPTNLKGEIKNPDSLNELLSRKSSGRRQSLSGGLMDIFTNPARGMDKRMLTNDLMLILNSMSTRPDSGLAQSIGMEQQQLAEARAKKGAFGGLTKEQFGIANTLRDDMRTDLELFRLVKGGYDTIQTLYDNPGAVSDYALAVAFAKIVDPGSVAREGEVRAVQNAGSMFPAFKQFLESALDVTGKTGRLSPVMRREIANLASQMYNTKAQDAQKSILNYERLAKKAGLKLEDIYVGNPNIEMGKVRSKPNTSKDINEGIIPPLNEINPSEKEKFIAEFKKRISKS